MDLDDSFTEKLIQRNKARRQFINETKMESPSVGKKRAALMDEQQICSSSPNKPSKESPKRQCIQNLQTVCSPHDKENFQMKDEDSSLNFVPFHCASKSRGLAALKKNFVEDNTEESNPKAAHDPQVNECSTYIFSTNSKELCSGKKSRFANLAADIRQWEDDTRQPTLSSNNVTYNDASESSLPPINTPNSKSNTFSMKLYYTNKSSDALHSGVHGDLGSDKNHTVLMRGKGDLGTVPVCEKGNIEVGSGASKKGRLPVWDEAIKATLNSPAISKYTKSKTDSTEDRMKETRTSENGSSLDDESIDEDDFAENYEDINSEHENAKMELDCSPAKPLKKHEDMYQKPVTTVKPAASVADESANKNVDPAELPLSARRALFEKALLGGTPKLNEDVPDQKLSVAQRAAMFENASKTKTEPRSTNFKEPKRIALSNFSKFDKTGNNQMVKSPVKTVQHAPKAEPEFTDSPIHQKVIAAPVTSPVKKVTAAPMTSPVKKVIAAPISSPVKKEFAAPVTSPAKKVLAAPVASPAKKVISEPVVSTPSASKHVGNHTRYIQQKLIENSVTNSTTKDIVSKVSQERKKEISGLVNHWEKLSSSSSVENNSEVERNNLASEAHVLSESDAVEGPSEYDEEYNSDYSNEDYENDEDGDQIDDQNDVECSDEESDIAENVFDLQHAEAGNMKYVQENYGYKQNSWQREDTQSTSSQNTRSGMSSPSFSGISSYSDDSNYNASKSQSCTSDSSARSYDAAYSHAAEGTSITPKESKNPEVPLLYTVSFYRKQKQETRLTPVRTIVRREKISSPESSDTDFTEMIQERIKALHEEVLRQQTVISQTSQALNLCSATTEFSGSTEQVEGEKLLLIATQKRQALLNEMTRLKTCGAQGENVADGTGTLLISDIHLPLKREFIASQLEGKGTDTVHYFLCLIRHGPQVIVTQMMSTDDKVADGSLCFTNHIKVQNLPADFSIVFEVYALQTKKEVLPHEKKYHIKREHSKIRLTPKGKKADGKILMPAISSPGGPNAVRSPSFGVVGFTRFTLQNCNKKTFTLDKVPFTSPLDGVLRVKLQLHAEHKVMEKGFLTMFEDVSGFGAWHRRWCALDAHRLAYWKYPDDEHKKEPIGSVDLKQCVTGQVKLVSRDICARPHTFQLVTIRPQEKGDKNTLISRSVNTLTTTKHLLSADTKDERILWCNKLNEALTNVRKWDPQALRPIETMQD